MKFRDQIVVLTGAAGGFGRELTRLLCARGACVEALDIDKKGLARLKKEMAGLGYAIRTRVLDVSKAASVKKFTDQLAKEKRVPRVWINNAGLAYPEAFEKMPAEKFDHILRVNLNGVIFGTRAALRLMTPRGQGTIVNVASVLGYLPSPFLTSYAASKFAIVGFTKSLSLELEQRGVAVKILLACPGVADTALTLSNTAFAVPPYLRWMLSRPDAIARDIVSAIAAGQNEVFPGFSGRILLALQKWLPQPIFRFSTRLFTARNFREAFGWEGIRSR